MYVDNLADIIIKSTFFQKGAIVLAFDKQMVNFPGFSRLTNPEPNSDFMSQLSHKVMRSAIRDDPAYNDVNLFFDNWVMSNEQQAELSKTAYDTCAAIAVETDVQQMKDGYESCQGAYGAACAWLNGNTDVWEPWIRCTDCPDTCKEDGFQGYCLQKDWDDGSCNTECNKRSCDHNDCLYSEIASKCQLEQETGAIDFREPPTPTQLTAANAVSDAFLELSSYLNHGDEDESTWWPPVQEECVASVTNICEDVVCDSGVAMGCCQLPLDQPGFCFSPSCAADRRLYESVPESGGSYDYCMAGQERCEEVCGGTWVLDVPTPEPTCPTLGCCELDGSCAWPCDNDNLDFCMYGEEQCTFCGGTWNPDVAAPDPTCISCCETTACDDSDDEGCVNWCAESEDNCDHCAGTWSWSNLARSSPRCIATGCCSNTACDDKDTTCLESCATDESQCVQCSGTWECGSEPTASPDPSPGVDALGDAASGELAATPSPGVSPEISQSYALARNLLCSLSPPPLSPPPSPSPPSPSPMSPPLAESELVSVNLQISFSSPMRLQISEEINEMICSFELASTTVWSDPRMEFSQCYQILPRMLRITFEEGEAPDSRAVKQANRELFWLPSLQLDGLAPGFDIVPETVDFEYSTNTSWPHDLTPPQGPAYCPSCVVNGAEFEVELLQPFIYKNYPFDVQVINISFSLDSADLYTCHGHDALVGMGIDQDNAEQLLLPATGTWNLYPKNNINESVKLMHPLGADGEPDRSRCVLSITVLRNSMIYVVKRLVTDVLVVFGGLLCGLWLVPDEMMGDRLAAILVALLIVVTSLQTDLGLGKLSYLIWVDIFNVVNLVILVLALFETLLVHYLFREKQDMLANYIDRMFRVVLPFGVYSVVLMGVIILGQDGMRKVGITILAVGITGMTMISVAIVNLTLLRGTRQRNAAVDRLRKAQDESMPRSKEFEELALQVFHCFDYDGSDLLDIDELKHIVKAMHPKLETGDVLAVVNEAFKISGFARGSLHHDEFEVWIRVVHRIVNPNDKQLASVAPLGGELTAAQLTARNSGQGRLDKLHGLPIQGVAPSNGATTGEPPPDRVQDEINLLHGEIREAEITRLRAELAIARARAADAERRATNPLASATEVGGDPTGAGSDVEPSSPVRHRRRVRKVKAPGEVVVIAERPSRNGHHSNGF